MNLNEDTDFTQMNKEYICSPKSEITSYVDIMSPLSGSPIRAKFEDDIDINLLPQFSKDLAKLSLNDILAKYEDNSILFDYYSRNAFKNKTPLIILTNRKAKDDKNVVDILEYYSSQHIYFNENFIDTNGWNALHYALKEGLLLTCKFLIKRTSIHYNFANQKKNETLLSYCVTKLDYNSLETLFYVNYVNPFNPVDVNITNNQGHNSLYNIFSAKKQVPEVEKKLRFLLDNGIQTTVRLSNSKCHDYYEEARTKPKLKTFFLIMTDSDEHLKLESLTNLNPKFEANDYNQLKPYKLEIDKLDEESKIIKDQLLQRYESYMDLFLLRKSLLEADYSFDYIFKTMKNLVNQRQEKLNNLRKI